MRRGFVVAPSEDARILTPETCAELVCGECEFETDDAWSTPSRPLQPVGIGMAALVLAMLWTGAAPAEPAFPIEEFAQLAQRCAPDVSPQTLAALAETESSFARLAIHDNTTGTTLAPVTDDEAIGAASRAIAAGHSLDLGLMQINSANLGRLGLTVEEAFEACRSIAAGAHVLRDAYAGGESHAEQQRALRVALSRYNTGDAQRGFANGYVGQVEAEARRLAVPALDIGASAGPAMPAPVKQRDAVQQRGSAPSWEVWPSDPSASAEDGGAPSSPPARGEATILADGGDAVTVNLTTPEAENTK